MKQISLNFGYKSKKVGTSTGTDFEFLDDLRLGLSTSVFIEDISTSSTASARQKKQKEVILIRI